MKGISPLISLVMVVAFGLAAIMIVMNVLTPTIDRARDSATINEAFQNLQLLNSIIKEVATESNGSKRTILLSVTDGTYKIDSTHDYLYFEFEPKERTKLGGVREEIHIETGEIFIDYFNHYLDGDNASSTWTILNGTWNISSGQYSGIGGIAYHNVGEVFRFELSGKIYNKTSVSGQIFILPVLPENLIGFWTFDEGTGNATYDFSMNSNNGTLKNGTNTCYNNDCPTWVNGKFSYGLRFDGINDYVDCGDVGTVKTIEFWIKTNTLTEDILQLNSSVNVSVSEGTISANGFSSPTIYVNGAEGSTLTTQWSHVAITTNSGINANEVKLGAVGTSYFNGTIDEVRIYNKTLTSSEVLQNYELSIKKLNETKTVQITNETNATIVLSAPFLTNFDDVKVKADKKELKLVIPYTKIDLIGTEHFSKGSHNIVIENKGLNSTSSKPMIEISSE